MKIRALLITAAVGALGVASSNADVTSVNVVGFINVTCGSGYTMIANQLNTTNNTVAQMFANVPGGFAIWKWSGTAYNANNFDADFGWDNPDMTLSPGEGAFAYNPYGTNIILTFVGEVPQGDVSLTIHAGFNMISSKVPQGKVSNGAGGWTGGLLQTDLGYTPVGGDAVLQWSGTFQQSSYDADFGWDNEPQLAVGEGFFLQRNTAGSYTWARTFNVQ